MKTCPQCNGVIRVNELPHQGLFASYRVCPQCGARIAVDLDTRYRQALLVPVAAFSLVFTVMLYSHGREWLVPVTASYIVMALLICWGNRKLYFVKHEEEK